MIISKQELQKEAIATGLRAELLEKVLILMDLLTALTTFPQLRDKLVLKGGTALNLFFFDLPRLSVDIDLNYIGNVDREAMLAERPFVLSTLIAICQRKGLTLERNPTVHAGGKMIWRYPSALGQTGNLEIDLNFMYRIPLWPIELKSSCHVGNTQIHNIPVLDIHELSAGKISALIDRKTGRDLFDTFHLLTNPDINLDKLRLALVIYSGMNRNIDLRHVTSQDIKVDIDDITKKLMPLLRKNEIMTMDSIVNWSEKLGGNCQKLMDRILPIMAHEKEFLTRLLEHGTVDPNLISDDPVLLDKIRLHPAIQWTAKNANGDHA